MKITSSLLGIVLDDPKKNNKKYLETEAKKFAKLPEKYLKELADKSKEEKMINQITLGECTFWKILKSF